MAKQSQQQQLDALTAAVAALLSQQQSSSSDSDAADKAEPKAKQSKTVKAENAAEPPTSKQSYILLMRAREAGLDSFSMPTTRGAAADLIGAVLSAKSKSAKVKVLTQ